MDLKSQIERDLKTALLSGDKDTATTLRGLKSVILNAEIAANKRETGLDDESIVNLLLKEAKKRQESADMYVQGGSDERAQSELKEKELIEKYLPKQMSEEELQKIIDEVLQNNSNPDIKQMGQIIGEVRQKTGNFADGATIARLVKERLSS